MRCTLKKNLDLIVQQGNDYLVGVKDNQRKLRQAMQHIAQHQVASSIDMQSEQTRDRVTERTVAVYDTPTGLAPRWSHARSVIVVRRSGTRAGEEFDRISYYLSSLSASAIELGLGIRGHRLIENGLHWVKDVVFGEDTARCSNHTPATNWSIVRNFVVNLFRQHGYAGITQAKRRLGHDLGKLFSLLNMN